MDTKDRTCGGVSTVARTATQLAMNAARDARRYFGKDEAECKRIFDETYAEAVRNGAVA